MLSLVKITEETLKADDEQGNDLVKFYTGLPCYVVLKIVYDHVAAHVKKHARSIPLFDQFFMVLMKLHLNLCDRDLAHRFSVSQSTVFETFKKWINIPYERLKPLIRWPADFKINFPKCVCVIDCFEVFCDVLEILWPQLKLTQTTNTIIQ